MTNYAKLNDGSWGIRSDEKLAVGQCITVAKRDGTSKSEMVTRVVTSGAGYSLATIRSSAARSPRATTRKNDSGVSRYCTSPRECENALSWDAPDRLCRSCSRYHYAE